MSNMIGKRNGKLLVIEYAFLKGKYNFWKCRCDCGNVVIKIHNDVVMGQSKSCGCSTEARNFSGDRFGKLLVLGLSHISDSGHRFWSCKCDCGKSIVIGGHQLLRNKHSSCGCDRFGNLIGVRYGRLLALGRVTDRASNGSIKWKCRCDCGTVKVVAADALRAGLTKSCGCLQREIMSTRQTTHGKSKSKIYKIWNSMNMRCKSGDEGHPDYGQRGIRVCEEWGNSFEAFYAYVGDKPAGKSLDRIDPDGNYCPGNVRWVDQTTQLVNQRMKHNNKSGVKGVSILQNGKFLAELKLYGKSVLKKEFTTLEEARAAREEAERIYHKPLLETK